MSRLGCVKNCIGNGWEGIRGVRFAEGKDGLAPHLRKSAVGAVQAYLMIVHDEQLFFRE